jgi:hypothetical protein
MSAGQEPALDLAASPEICTSSLSRKCPGCQTADLTYGRRLCQACGVLRAMGSLAPPETSGEAG